MTDPTLRERLEGALAPEPEYDPVQQAFAIDDTCTADDCDRAATEWFRDPTGAHLRRCMDHGDPRFRVDNDDKANWALHRLRAERARLAEIDGLYQAELDRLTEFRRTERARHERSEKFFEDHLIAYGLRLRATDQPGKERASHALPAGTINMRRSTVLNVTDPPKLLAWAEESHPELVDKSIGKQPVKDLLKKDPKLGLQPCTADGEVVPGIEIVRQVNPSVITPP